MTTRPVSSLYLDSAALDDVRAGVESGLVAGITTNPALMAGNKPPPLQQLAALLSIFPEGPIFYQADCADSANAEHELSEALALAPERVVLKLPAQQHMFALGRRMGAQGARVAFTAVYHPGQALCAAAAGAEWVIPYVDRAQRLQPDGPPLLPTLAAALASAETRILAASLKSGDQVVDAICQGAHAVTAPWHVITALMQHPVTDSAVDEFAIAVERRST